jgi:hypothetical protein
MLLILLISVVGWLNELGNWITSGADLGFQVRGAHVKKLRRKIAIFHTKYPNNFRASLRHWKNMIFWRKIVILR